MKRPMFFFEGDGAGGTGGGGTAAAAAPAAGGASTTLLGDAAAAGGGQQQQAGGGQPGAWSWAKEDGTFSEGWLDKLPGDLNGHASLRSIGNVPDLAKSYVETKKLIGTKLEMPGEGATPEAVAAWRKTVGAPEKPEGYLGDAKSLRPEGIPEDQWDAAGEKEFLALAHKHSLPPGAVKDIMAFYGNSIAKGLQASQVQEGEVLKAEGAKLRQAWGGEFDANMQMAARVAQTVGLDPKTHPMFTSADAVQAFAKIGKLLSEDKLVKGDSQGVNGAVSDRIRDITDPKSASVSAREYRGEFGPERQAAAQALLHDLYSSQAQK